MESVASEAIANGQFTWDDWKKKWSEISKMQNTTKAWREFGKMIIKGPK